MAEKSLNEVSRDLRMLFQKGNDALARENYDYAVDLYMQVLEKEPSFYDARKALRNAQFKKSGSSRGFFKKVLSSAGSSPMVAKGQITLRKNPAEAMIIAEQILNSDPQSSAAHRLFVDAAAALELPRAAAMSLEILVNNSPKDRDLAIKFAQALAAIGDANRAERFLAEYMANHAYDNEVSQALKDVSAKKTLDEKGYQSVATGQGSYRDILKDKKEAVSLEQEKRVEKSEDTSDRLIHEKEERLKSEPENLKVMRDLADLYTQRKMFEKALSYCEMARKTTAGASDPTLDGSIADIRVRQFEQQLETLNPAAPDFAEQTARIQAEKLAYQMAECQKRAEKFPTDLAIRYELGVLYFQAGKVGEAIPELQKAQGNPHRRIAAMNYLGQCFARRKMFDLAARQFQNAIKEKPIFDDEKKDLIYNLGSVFESMGKKAEAIDEFKQIYEVDSGFRDVSAKMDAFYAGQ